MSKDYVPQTPLVDTKTKLGMNEHRFKLPGRMRGGSVTECEMLEPDVKKWQFLTPSGNEAKITEVTGSYTQETMRGRATGLYIMEKGWVACFVCVNDETRVHMAFAGTDKFYLIVPPGGNYVVRFSGGSVFKFESPDKSLSLPIIDDMYDAVTIFSDDEILVMYAQQHNLSLNELASLVTTSMTRRS